MEPLNPIHIVNLFLKRGHDGYYLNGHPEVCAWLDSNPEKQYYIQQMPDELGVISYNNVRIWSSETAMREAEQKRIQITEEPTISPQKKEPAQTDPIVLELYDAVARKDLVQVVALKRECRLRGLRFDKAKTDVRNLI